MKGQVALILDLAKAFERVRDSLWCGQWATHFSFPRKLAGAVWFLRAPGRVQFEGCVAEPLRTIHGHLAGVNVELLAFAFCIGISPVEGSSWMTSQHS